jgi:hypothetical protein
LSVRHPNPNLTLTRDPNPNPIGLDTILMRMPRFRQTVWCASSTNQDCAMVGGRFTGLGLS